MKGYAAGIAAALMLLLLISGAAAQEEMRLYVEKGALEEAQIRQMLALLDLDDTRWMQKKKGGALFSERRPMCVFSFESVYVCMLIQTWSQTISPAG